jgi:hypothetical protein
VSLAKDFSPFLLCNLVLNCVDHPSVSRACDIWQLQWFEWHNSLSFLNICMIYLLCVLICVCKSSPCILCVVIPPLASLCLLTHLDLAWQPRKEWSLCLLLLLCLNLLKPLAGKTSLCQLLEVILVPCLNLAWILARLWIDNPRGYKLNSELVLVLLSCKTFTFLFKTWKPKNWFSLASANT